MVVKKIQAPEEPREPSPQITPEMLQTAFKALESRGMIYYSEKGVYVPTESGWKLLMKTKAIEEQIIAYGHPKITATSLENFKITKLGNVEDSSVIAVRANKACKDLKEEIKEALKEAKNVQITLDVDGIKDTVAAYGSPALKLTNSEDIVVRKDDFIDNYTLAILANKSANELKQELIEKLRNSNTKVRIILETKP